MAYKILMVTMGLDIGGAETHIVELSKQLHSMGYEVAVVSNGGVYVPEITAAGIRHYNAPLHRRSVSCMWKSLNILRRVIREEKPDVVHAHARIPAFLCGLLCRHTPFVTSCHGVYRTGNALRLLSDWGERTIAVSDDIRDYLIREYNIPAGHIRMTINGIDTEKFSPQHSGAAAREALGLGDAPVIVHVSRLEEDSSLAARQLVELAPELERAFPGIRIVIVGGGGAYDSLAGRAREVNRALGKECLVLTGPRTDINDLTAACDLFVGVSRAALEAMASGKPVVLSGAQGHTGLFQPQILDKAVGTNFCCRTDPTATPPQLLEDIVRALSLPPEQRAELGRFGREVVLKHYSVYRMARDCIDVYEQVRRRAHRVLLSGYYGFSNAGDDAILQSIRDNIQSASSDVSVAVLSNDPKQTGTRYGIPAFHRFRLFQVLKAVKECDVLVSGGGSLLQDRTSSRSLIYYLSIIRLAQWRRKKVMFYANGIGPVSRPANRRRVARAVERADMVTLRDHSSLEELREMGVTREDLRVTADPVFNLECADAQQVDALLARLGVSGQRFAVIAVRPWPGQASFPAELAKLCDHLYERHGLTCLFLLMQPEHDLEISRQVAKQMACPAVVLEGGFTPPELMGIISRSRLCVAMRLHTLIFAAKVGVPMVGLVYDPKVTSYLKELGMPSAGDTSDFSSARAIALTDGLMADYDRQRAELEQRTLALTQAAKENERLLLKLLEQ